MNIKRILKFYLIRLFRLKKGAKQISLGLVAGFVPNWFPTFGLGPLISVVLARLVRGNIPAAIISASLGSLIWPFLFYLNYKVGCLFLYPTPAHAEEVNKGLLNAAQDISILFFVGAFLNTILFGTLSYFLFYFIFSQYRDVILRRIQGET